MLFKKRLNRKTEGCIYENKDEESQQQPFGYESIKKILGQSEDIIFQNILINSDKRLQAVLVFAEGMVNLAFISDYILKPLIQENSFKETSGAEDIIDMIESGGLYFTSHEKSSDMKKIIDDILSGKAALFIEQCEAAILFDVKGFDKRSISETSSENITKGAKDAFTETLSTNTALIRRKIKSSSLIVERTIVGSETQTSIAVIYVKGAADSEIVKSIKDKLNNINITGISSTSAIEELIVDNPSFIFPQLLNTERPDKFCADLLEGMVGLIIDGFPVAFLLPARFFQFIQAPEDYAYNYIFSSGIRLMRYVLIFLTLFFPGFYISMTSFNPEMLPTNLAHAIAQYRSGVTFPTFIETILMLVAFEILLEAGNRMPKNIGQTVSIVGGLVVGQAAVNAKLVSPSVVIIVALTAIANFNMPNLGFNNALRLWRLIITIISSIFGLVGLVFCFIVLLFTLVNAENFGIPYMEPLVSADEKDLNDTFLRLPLKKSKTICRSRSKQEGGSK